jgi:hypothetical protein
MARSRQVTVVAWLSIVLCALCGLMAGLDTLVLAAMAGSDALQSAATDPAVAGLLTPEIVAMMESGAIVPWFAVGTLACVAGLVASVGLLVRREWGRRAFVVLVLAGIPVAWAGVVAAHVLAWPTWLVAGSYLCALVVTGVHVWLARVLGRDSVRAEFTRVKLASEPV